MQRRKESLFSFHLACAVFPTVVFTFHGERGDFWVQKYKFLVLLAVLILGSIIEDAHSVWNGCGTPCCPEPQKSVGGCRQRGNRCSGPGISRRSHVCTLRNQRFPPNRPARWRHRLARWRRYSSSDAGSFRSADGPAGSQNALKSRCFTFLYILLVLRQIYEKYQYKNHITSWLLITYTFC